MIWPLTGRTGSGPRRPDQAPAATTTRSARQRAEIVDALAPQLPARGLDGVGQRRDEAARVDGVVAGHVERQPHGRGERGLGAARLARAQPLDREVELPAVGVELVELLGVVAVARDDQGAGAAQSGIAAGGLLELGAEGGEAGGRAEAEVEQRLLAELRLGDRGEHAGGVAPRAVLGGVEHERAQAALRRAPGDGEADDAAADDGYVVLLGLRRHCVPPSLRRHHPDQVRRSAAWVPPSQPVRRAPVMRESLALQHWSHDPSRAGGGRTPVPRLRRAAARVPGRCPARGRRPDPAARQDRSTTTG